MNLDRDRSQAGFSSPSLIFSFPQFHTMFDTQLTPSVPVHR